MDAGERRDLEAEQRHLDETYAAYDTALRLLRSRARTSGVDDFATEALERMRVERVRAYDAASGPLYFGRIDGRDGRALYIGRHAVADEADRLLAINWRAPSARPFYAAGPRRRRAPAAARHRGAPRARVRRRVARRRRRGPPHRRDRRGHRAPARRRDAAD